jgi:probable rRNA maturation factor
VNALLAAVAALTGVEADPKSVEATILLAGDGTLRTLNREFRGKDEATDVLSFPAFDTPKELKAAARLATSIGVPLYLGDLAVSVATAKRQAKAHGLTLEQEVVVLVTHGLLHLVGFDHMKPSDAKRMAAAERELLAAIWPAIVTADKSRALIDRAYA